MIAAICFTALFAASMCLNVYYWHIRKTSPKPKPDITAQDLLHDLTTRGAAILRVEVMDPSQLLLRSPRR